jgi:hypothetical protein
MMRMINQLGIRMGKKNEAEELWDKIKEKQLSLLAKYVEQSGRFNNMTVNLRELLDKFDAIADAAELVMETDNTGKSPEVIEFKRIEPINSYTCAFLDRENELLSSKPFTECVNAIHTTFVRRMNAFHEKAHKNNYNPTHVKKMLMAFDKEIDELSKQFEIFEKDISEFISEFEDIKRVAAFEEN